MMTVRQALKAEYRIKLYEFAAICLSITILWAGGIWGVAKYVGDQAEDSRHDAATSQYAAATAIYENARDELLRCTQRVESREQIRGAFLDVFDLLDDTTPGNAFTKAARERLDESYPLLVLEDCPASPVPPTPPQ